MNAQGTRRLDGLKSQFGRFQKDRSGATAIEYALVAGFISISILVVLGSISDSVRVNFFELVAGMF